MVDLFDGYVSTLLPKRRSGSAAWDEMFAEPSGHGPVEARAAYKEIYRALAQMTKAELRGRTDALASSYLAQGVTFDFARAARP